MDKNNFDIKDFCPLLRGITDFNIANSFINIQDQSGQLIKHCRKSLSCKKVSFYRYLRNFLMEWKHANLMGMYLLHKMDKVGNKLITDLCKYGYIGHKEPNKR